MKKFRQTFLLAAALVVSFVGCYEDIPSFNTSEYKTVSMKIGNGAETRGISESVPAGTAVSFNTGSLFLLNSDGVIVRHYSITDRNSPTSDFSISRSDFDTQVTLTDIPGQVTGVSVVGNTHDNNTAGTIETVGKQLIDIISQNNANNVNLIGNGTLTATGWVHPTSGNEVWECNILLSPTVARFEIADITGAGEIERFTVEGIFIDKYYRKAQIGGAVTAENFVSNGQEADRFAYGSDAYPSALTPALFDWGAWSGSRNTSLTVAPENGKVWAYQLFAQTDKNENATIVPSIVIRIRDIVLRDGTQIQGTRFLTVRGIETGNGVLDGIRAGTVYKFPEGGIEFDERDLATRPNENAVDARIIVALDSWEEENVTLPQQLRQYNPISVEICFSNATFATEFNTPTQYVTGYVTEHLFRLQEATGGSGDYSYQWQESRDDGITWTDISHNPTAQTASFHLVDVLETGKVYLYRRAVTDNATGERIVSAFAKVSEPPVTRHFPQYVTMNGVTVSNRNLYTPGVLMDNPIEIGLFYRGGDRIAWQPQITVSDLWFRTGTRPFPFNGTLNHQHRSHNGNRWSDWEDIVWDSHWSSNHSAAAIWDESRNPCPPGWRLPNLESGEMQQFIEGFGGGRHLSKQEAAAEGCGCFAGFLFEKDGINFFINSGSRNTPFDNFSNSVLYVWSVPNWFTPIVFMTQGGTDRAGQARCVKDVAQPVREIELDKEAHFSFNGSAVSIGTFAGTRQLRVFGEYGIYTYQWQISTDGVNWDNITWAASREQYLWFSLNNPHNFRSDSYFRRVTVSHPSGDTLISNKILITMSDIGR